MTPTPPAVYVPEPLPNPLAFDEIAPPRPRPQRRREREPDEPERGGNRGLLVALVVLAAILVAFGAWFVVGDMRDAHDRARVGEIRHEFRALLNTYSDLTDKTGPAAKRMDEAGNALWREYHAIAARHPNWRVPPLVDD